jgi:hypothetical protein
MRRDVISINTKKKYHVTPYIYKSYATETVVNNPSVNSTVQKQQSDRQLEGLNYNFQVCMRMAVITPIIELRFSTPPNRLQHCLSPIAVRRQLAPSLHLSWNGIFHNIINGL